MTYSTLGRKHGSEHLDKLPRRSFMSDYDYEDYCRGYEETRPRPDKWMLPHPPYTVFDSPAEGRIPCPLPGSGWLCNLSPDYFRAPNADELLEKLEDV